MFKDIKKVFNKYKDYDYIDPDFATYFIKSPEEFDEQHGGICWDFVVAIANELNKYDIPYTCYFSEVQKRDKTVATHTYIIADGYWIECSWQKYKGIRMVDSFTDIENLLLRYYKCNEVHTVSYNPLKTVGKTDNQFFFYLNEYGKELS
jgi:hypothetical protein